MDKHSTLLVKWGYTNACIKLLINTYNT
jgi:hypothetical protein